MDLQWPPKKAVLPIHEYAKELLEFLNSTGGGGESDGIGIIVGATGSGKTTQVPQAIYSHWRGADGEAEPAAKKQRTKGGKSGRGAVERTRACIAVTQPRRVAAKTLAARVASEVGSGPVGGLVGYAVRFDRQVGPRTAVRFVTDGWLLREALGDGGLSHYTHIVVDEAHERSVSTDVLLALLRDEVVKRRTTDRPLRLIIMSATLDAGKFSEYFFNAPVLTIPGRQHPIATTYQTKPVSDLVAAVVSRVISVHEESGEEEGNILVFLPGQDEIESVSSVLSERIAELDGAVEPPATHFGGRQLVVLSIFSAMPSERQMLVFTPTPTTERRVILATNIAETSVTIPGIRVVIDSGLVKVREFQATTGMESLRAVPVSRASADQRAGRAGREGPGACYRLYTKAAFDGLEAVAVPEIRRTNLASVVLQLKALGISDVARFPFMDRPSKDAMRRAFQLLLSLRALDARGEITKVPGRLMVALPLDPRFSATLVAAATEGCLEEALSVVAMFSVDDAIFYAPREERAEADASRRRFGGAAAGAGGDHLLMAAVFRDYQAQPEELRKEWCARYYVSYRAMRRASAIRDQLLGHCEAAGLVPSSCGTRFDKLGRSFARGFATQSAMPAREGSGYVTVTEGRKITVHPSSVLHGRKIALFVYIEAVATNRTYARGCIAIDRKWLPTVHS